VSITFFPGESLGLSSTYFNKENVKMMKKPVVPIIETACGGIIIDPSKYPTAEYKGKTIYFCNEACLQAFLTDPDGFVAGEVEHPE
jgi:YHS domain-containing protein